MSLSDEEVKRIKARITLLEWGMRNMELEGHEHCASLIRNRRVTAALRKQVGMRKRRETFRQKRGPNQAWAKWWGTR